MGAIEPSTNLMAFAAIGGVAALAAVGVVAFGSAVRSALCLVLNFFLLAILYFTLGAEMLGILQIVVYTGAIMVLFLFVIMLLGAESLPGISNWRKIWFPATLAVILFLEATYLLVVKARPAGDVLQPDASVNTMENLRQLGTSLFSDYLLPFEVVSILLLVAMVGAIILTKKEKGAR